MLTAAKKYGAFLALGFALVAPALGQPPTATKTDRDLVSMGESQAAIVQQLGQPSSVVQGLGRTFLMYPEGRIVLESDRAVEIPLALQAPYRAPAAAATAAPADATDTDQAAAPATPATTDAPVVATTGAGTPVPAAAPARHGFRIQLPMWAIAIIAAVLVIGGFKVWDRLWDHTVKKKPEEPVAEEPQEEAKVPYRRSSDTLPPIPTNHFAFEHSPLAPSNPPFKPRPQADTRAPIPLPPAVPAPETKNTPSPLPMASETRPPMRTLKLSRKQEDTPAEESPS